MFTAVFQENFKIIQNICYKYLHVILYRILLCVFYSVLNMSATALFDTLPKTMLWLLPTPLTTFWSAGDMAAHGIKMDLEQMTGLIPSTFQCHFGAAELFRRYRRSGKNGYSGQGRQLTRSSRKDRNGCVRQNGHADGRAVRGGGA